MNLSYIEIKTKLGILHAVGTNNYLISLNWGEKRFFESLTKKPNLFLKETKKQINFYMQEKKINFDIPLDPKGTNFQKKVWKNINNIKWGKSTSYKRIAKKIFKEITPFGPRSVGNACFYNPIIILIPCHRIICSNGNIGGYNNKLWRKKKLLSLEK